MAHSGLASVVIAAGKGVRMKSDLPKVLHRANGKALLSWVLDAALAVSSAGVVAVIGHGADRVREAMASYGDGVSFVEQKEQLGTGHAVLAARGAVSEDARHVLILSGDVPLVRLSNLEAFIEAHRDGGADLSLVSVEVDNPAGYGRVLRGADGAVEGIVEDRDATEAQRGIREINVGIYLAERSNLFDALDEIGNDNDQGEYYLPDAVGIVKRAGGTVQALSLGTPDEYRGVNSREQLAGVARELRARKNLALMGEGVTLVDPEACYIEECVQIGRDTVVWPGVVLEGQTRIGQGCTLGPGAVLRDMTVGDGVIVEAYTVASESIIEDAVSIGPFARLRPGARLCTRSKVGNFVEVKKSTLGEGSKAGHLAYIGDATLGKNVNVGAGMVTCNYDGKKKNPSTVGDGVFIGTNTTLVAPLAIGDGAYVAGGSTVNRDVPAGALAIGRARQVNKEGYRAILDERLAKKGGA